MCTPSALYEAFAPNGKRYRALELPGTVPVVDSVVDVSCGIIAPCIRSALAPSLCCARCGTGRNPLCVSYAYYSNSNEIRHVVLHERNELVCRGPAVQAACNPSLVLVHVLVVAK